MTDARSKSNAWRGVHKIEGGTSRIWRPSGRRNAARLNADVSLLTSETRPLGAPTAADQGPATAIPEDAIDRDAITAAEPGGAAAFAALLSGRYQPQAGERVGVLVSGGNTTAVDFSW